MRWVCIKYCGVESGVEDYELATKLACRDDYRGRCVAPVCCDYFVYVPTPPEKLDCVLSAVEEFCLRHRGSALLGGVVDFVEGELSGDYKVVKSVPVRTVEDLLKLLEGIKSFLLEELRRGEINEVLKP